MEMPTHIVTVIATKGMVTRSAPNERMADALERIADAIETNTK